MEHLAKLSHAFQARPIQPYIFRNAIRPPDFTDEQGFRSAPLDRVLQAHQFDTLMPWTQVLRRENKRK